MHDWTLSDCPIMGCGRDRGAKGVQDIIAEHVLIDFPAINWRCSAPQTSKSIVTGTSAGPAQCLAVAEGELTMDEQQEVPRCCQGGLLPGRLDDEVTTVAEAAGFLGRWTEASVSGRPDRAGS